MASTRKIPDQTIGGMFVDDPLYDSNSFPNAGMFGAGNTSAQQPTFMDKLKTALIAVAACAVAFVVVLVLIAAIAVVSPK